LIRNAGSGSIDHKGLGGRSEVKANSSRDSNRPSPRVKVDVFKADYRAQKAGPKRWLVADLVEITVVAQDRHRIAHRWVDRSSGPLGNQHRNLESLKKQ
jgi:hypothetical protein